MNKHQLIGTIAVSTLLTLGAGYFFVRMIKRRRKAAKVAPVAVSPADCATQVQSVSVQEEPESACTHLYTQYKKLTAFVSGDEKSAMLESKQLRMLKIHGKTVIKEADTLMAVTQTPESFVSNDKHEQITLYYSVYEPNISVVIIVKYAEHVWTMTMPADDRFVATGPCFKQCDSLGYLNILLDTYMESLGL